jgi:hypothetical protein
MADERVQAAVSHWAARFIANGIDYNDFVRTTAAPCDTILQTIAKARVRERASTGVGSGFVRSRGQRAAHMGGVHRGRLDAGR